MFLVRVSFHSPGTTGLCVTLGHGYSLTASPLSLVPVQVGHVLRSREVEVFSKILIWLVVSTPLKNMKVSWDDYSQYMEKKCSKPPITNMFCFNHMMLFHITKQYDTNITMLQLVSVKSIGKTQAGSQHILPSDFMSSTFHIPWASSPSQKNVICASSSSNAKSPPTTNRKKKKTSRNQIQHLEKQNQRPSDFHWFSDVCRGASWILMI